MGKSDMLVACRFIVIVDSNATDEESEISVDAVGAELGLDLQESRRQADALVRAGQLSWTGPATVQITSKWRKTADEARELLRIADAHNNSAASNQ